MYCSPETLGDGLERVVGDEAHEETRRRIRSGAAGAHIAAGFRGLGLGILGDYCLIAYVEFSSSTKTSKSEMSTRKFLNFKISHYNR